MRLTYDMLKKFTLSQLKKKGFSDEKIIRKLSKFYLSENRQLTISAVNPTKSLSKALSLLKKGKVSQGKLIEVTAREQLKKDLSNLRKLAKRFDKEQNNLASNLLLQYEKGEINIYKMHNLIQHITESPWEYFDKSKYGNDTKLQLIIDQY